MRVASVIAALLALTAAAASQAADFQRKVAAEPKGSVQISNVAGRVSVSGWDRPEVEVTGNLGSGVDRVDVSSSGGRTVIRVVLPRRNNHSDGSADLDVRIPNQSDLDVSVVSADLDTTGLLGPQRLKSVSGDIRAQVAGVDFEGKTVSGDMRLTGNGKAADLRISTVSGDIVVERSAGEVEATTVSGDMRLELNDAHSVRMRTTSGDLSFRGSFAKGASLDAETISSDLTVRARGGGFEYEAVSFSGDIGNGFGVRAERTSRHGPGSRLSGTEGNADARVRVKTMSGDVELCNR